MYVSVGKQACRSLLFQRLHRRWRSLLASVFPREIRAAGAWAVPSPLAVQVCYQFACSLAQFCLTLRQWTYFETEEISRSNHILSHAWKFSQLSAGENRQWQLFCLTFACYTQLRHLRRGLKSHQSTSDWCISGEASWKRERAFWLVPSIVPWQVLSTSEKCDQVV